MALKCNHLERRNHTYYFRYRVDNYFGMVDRSDGAKHFLSLILSISVANETDKLHSNIKLKV